MTFADRKNAARASRPEPRRQAGTITALATQRFRQDRVNIYLDDEFAFGLTTEVAQAALLKVGDRLDAATITQLLAREEFQVAFNRACAFLSYRPRSEREVRQNLAAKGLDPSLIERVVTRLRELGYVDDAAFARFWVENRSAFRPRGARALAFELRLKGVDQAVGREAIDEGTDDEDGAYRAGLKKARSLAQLDESTFRQRLSAFLVRRGFGYDVVTPTVWRLRQEVAPDGVTDSDDAVENADAVID